jgi:uncharacterized protein (TIGR03067 family)
MKSFYTLGVFMTVLALAVGNRGEDRPKGEHLEGSWTCVSAVVNGKPLPDATVKLLRLNLTKDQYKTVKGNETLFESSYTLEPSRNPPHINIVGTEGDLKGKEALGIYSLAQDTLKICYTMPGKQRPTAFASGAGSEAYFMVWKRQNL